MAEDPPSPAFVEWLVDTSAPKLPTVRSAVGLAIRDARQLMGRNVVTGIEVERHRGGPDPRILWPGALLYFIVLEQLGICFRSPAKKTPKRREIAWSLAVLGGIDARQAEDLQELRNRFAHDYSLRDKGGGSYVLDMTKGPLIRHRADNHFVSLHELSNCVEDILSGLPSTLTKGGPASGGTPATPTAVLAKDESVLRKYFRVRIG